MNNRITYSILKHLSLCLIVMFVFDVANAQTKRALLIGISEYSQNDNNSWENIHGANDVALIASTLKSKNFRVTKLTNKQATAKRIREEFNSLVRLCQPGDIVYIHFSGHGQPYEDVKPYDEEDGWDESIIPYDAQKIYCKGKYEGTNHILDDELHLFFEQIRNKIGLKGFLCVVIDACHAGGASRGDDLEEDEEVFIRGTKDAFSPNGKIYRPRINTNGHFIINKNNKQGDIVILEACRSYQSNFEIKQDGKYFGPLSYYVNKTLLTHQLTNSLNWVQEVKRMMDGDQRLTRQNMVYETSLK